MNRTTNYTHSNYNRPLEHDCRKNATRVKFATSHILIDQVTYKISNIGWVLIVNYKFQNAIMVQLFLAQIIDGSHL